MRSTTITLLALMGMVTGVTAGDYYSGGKAPLPAKAPIEECLDIGGEISAGYKTDYILHGLRVNRDSVWVDTNYTFDSLVPLTLGVSHLSGINSKFPYGLAGPIDETDLYLRADLGEFAGFQVGLSYTQRFLHFSAFPAGNGSYADVSIDIRRDLGFADFVIGSTLGLNSRNGYFNAGGGDGFVHYAGLEKSIAVCDYADVVLSGGVGYHDGYYFSVPGTHDWSHYYINASLPLELNCRTTLTPYIGYQGVQQWGVFFPQGDALHAGVSLNVTF